MGRGQGTEGGAGYMHRGPFKCYVTQTGVGGV